MCSGKNLGRQPQLITLENEGGDNTNYPYLHQKLLSSMILKFPVVHNLRRLLNLISLQDRQVRPVYRPINCTFFFQIDRGLCTTSSHRMFHFSHFASPVSHRTNHIAYRQFRTPRDNSHWAFACRIAHVNFQLARFTSPNSVIIITHFKLHTSHSHSFFFFRTDMQFTPRT